MRLTQSHTPPEWRPHNRPHPPPLRPADCSPSRSSYQSGRLPIHVNVVNLDMSFANASDPVSGFAGVPRNMTGIAAKLKSAGYATHMVGKWDAGMATPDHTPKGRGYDSSLIYFHHAND